MGAFHVVGEDFSSGLRSASARRPAAAPWRLVAVAAVGPWPPSPCPDRRRGCRPPATSLNNGCCWCAHPVDDLGGDVMGVCRPAPTRPRDAPARPAFRARPPIHARQLAAEPRRNAHDRSPARPMHHGFSTNTAARRQRVKPAIFQAGAFAQHTSQSRHCGNQRFPRLPPGSATHPSSSYQQGHGHDRDR